MKIDMTEVQKQKTTLSTSQTSITSQLETAKTSFVNLVNSESLKGDVKGAIDAKISNHQVPLLTNFSNALAVLSAQYDKTIEQFKSTVSETAADAIIDTDYLQGLLDGFSSIETNISTVNQATANIYSSISDIISLTNPDASTITTPLSEGKTILTDTKANMASFNGWKRGDEFNTILQSQTQTLGSLSSMGQLSFTDIEARAFYKSEDFLDAVDKVASKAKGATPVELLEFISKKFNKDLGKWKKWTAYDYFVGYMDEDIAKRLLQLAGLTPSSLTSSILKSDGLWELLAAIESKGPKGYKFVSKVLDLMVKYESWKKFTKPLDTVVEWVQNGTSLVETGAKWVLKKVSGIKYLGDAVEKGKNLVGEAKFLGKGIKYLGKLGTILTFAELGITGISSGINEFSKTGHVGKAVTGGMIDTVKSIGPLEGATIGGTIGGAIGTAIPIPGLGTVSGAAFGAGVGFVVGGVNYLAQLKWPNLYDDAKKVAYKVIDKIDEGIDHVKKFASNEIGGIGKALGFG